MTINNQLSELLKTLYETRTQKNALDKVEKAILAELKPIVDPKFDALDAPIVDSGIVLTRTSGTTRSIQSDLLLERGVSPDVINYATKVTTFFQYRTKESK